MINRRQLLRTMGAAAGSILGTGLTVTSWAAAERCPKLRVAFLTDFHGRLDLEVPARINDAIAIVRSSGCDVAVGGGDYVTEGIESSTSTMQPRWEMFCQTLRGLNLPFYPAIGNHDLTALRPPPGEAAEADPRREFRSRFGLERTYWSVDVGGYRIIALDAISPVADSLVYRGLVDKAQLKWLRKLLRRTPLHQPIILVSHIPLLTSFYLATQGGTASAPANRVVINNKDVLSLFEPFSLLAVLQGHLHVNEQIRWRNTLFVGGGAICGRWWQGDWQGTPPGFGVLECEGHEARWEYHPLPFATTPHSREM